MRSASDAIHKPQETSSDNQAHSHKLLHDSGLLDPSDNRSQRAQQQKTAASTFTGFEPLKLTDKNAFSAEVQREVEHFLAIPAELAKASHTTSDSSGRQMIQINESILPPIHVDLKQFRYYENNDSLTMKDVANERQKLLVRAAAYGLDTKEFTQHMNDLQARIPKEIKASEAAGVYHHLSSLLALASNANFSTSDKERAALVKQVLAQAADPHEVSQGFHNTCNVASIENLLYSHHPASVARMVSELARTGSYTDANGASVTVNAHPRDFIGDEFVNPGKDDRSYASELFQVAAVNLYYKELNLPEFHYEQSAHPRDPVYKNGKAVEDTGESLCLLEKKVTDSPRLDPDASMLLPNAITGLKDAPRILYNSDLKYWLPKDSCTTGLLRDANLFSNEKEFENKLAELKAHNGFPVILSVNVGNAPFVDDDPKLAGVEGGRHAITIQDYIPGTGGKPGKVLFDNPWGKAFNHNTVDSAISVHEMYISTLEPVHARALWKRDADAGMKSRHPNEYAELEELRLGWTAHQLTANQFAEKIHKESVKMADDLNNHRLSTEDYRSALTKLAKLAEISAKANYRK